MRTALALGAIVFAAWFVPQDPVRTTTRPSSGPASSGPASRPDAKPARDPLPPVQEPFRSRVERKDLLQEFGAASPLEGFYRLRGVVRNGVYVGLGFRGFVWFGRGHMSLHTAVSEAVAGDPYIQASVRRYRVEGDRLTMTTLVGHEHADELRVEASGRVEVRTFRRTGSALRIYRDAGNYLEFVRLE